MNAFLFLFVTLFLNAQNQKREIQSEKNVHFKKEENCFFLNFCEKRF